ncbi:MAG: flagellar biosynthesis protein FlhB, partial [Rhodobacteraceae bacterium]|nr:flagellar biosynthesis protein FlhB [Paracoccaceae bacterium]
MAEESAQEKTEDPTPKRLEKALEDGQVLTSKELFVFSTLFTGFLMYFLILMFSDRILGEFKGFFSFDLSDFQGELLRMTSGAVSFILVYGVLFAIPIFFVVLFTQGVLSGGINVSAKAMSFKGSRINPLEGLKRMFSTKALVELAKAVLKVSLLLGTAALVISLYMPQLTTSSNANLLNGLSRAGDVFVALMVTLLIGLVVIAFLDVLWQRYQHIEKL